MSDLFAPLLSSTTRASMNEAFTVSRQIREAYREEKEEDGSDDDAVGWMMCWMRLAGEDNRCGSGSDNERDVMDEIESSNDLDAIRTGNNAIIENDKNNQSYACTYWTGWLVSVVLLPLLLWLQLFLALHSTRQVHLIPFSTAANANGNNDPARQHQVWDFVQSGVLCFVVASVLYRHAVADLTCTEDVICDDDTTVTRKSSTTVSWGWLIVSLAPEICTDVILLMVVLDQIALAILWMHVSTLAFIGSAIVLSMCTCRLRIIPHYRGSSAIGESDDFLPEPAKPWHWFDSGDTNFARGTLPDSNGRDHEIFGLLNVTVA